MSKVVLLNPEAPAPAGASAAAQRKLNRAELRIGVLDNSKGNADHLLRFIVEGLQEKMKFKSVVQLRKGSVSEAAPADILQRLAGETDFVFSAMAD